MPGNAAAEGGFGRDAPSRPDNDNDRGGAREDKESKAEKAESFDRAMDNANRPDRAPAGVTDTATTVDDDKDDRNTTDRSDDGSDRAAGPPGTGAPPSSTSASHPASEFSGLGASGGPVDNTLSGDDSRNSHRGYGPDDSLAGGIDDGVNAGLAAADANHPANEFSGLGASGGPADDTLSDDDSLSSHHGHGLEEEHPSGIDVQGRLDELDRQIAEQKALEDPYESLFDTRDTPNVNTPEHPTELNDIPEATSVVYSGDTPPPPSTTADDDTYDFATDMSAAAARFGGLTGISAGLFGDHLTPGALDSLKSAGLVSIAVGPAAETLEATLNAEPEDRVKSGFEGFLGSVDDFAVGIGVTGFFGGATGAGLGMAAALAYDNSPPDKAFDEGVRAASDTLEEGIETTTNGIEDFERSLIERALGHVKRQALNR